MENTSLSLHKDPWQGAAFDFHCHTLTVRESFMAFLFVSREVTQIHVVGVAKINKSLPGLCGSSKYYPCYRCERGSLLLHYEKCDIFLQEFGTDDSMGCMVPYKQGPLGACLGFRNLNSCWRAFAAALELLRSQMLAARKSALC